jgi:ABC-2 type transport system ATP-binding protein
VIAGLRDQGKTIFLTTHYMEEAEHLADQIAVIARRIVAEGTASTLGGRDLQVTSVTGDKVEAETRSPLPLLGALAAWAQARNVDLADLQEFRPTLEAIYLQLTRVSR